MVTNDIYDKLVLFRLPLLANGQTITQNIFVSRGFVVPPISLVLVVLEVGVSGSVGRVRVQHEPSSLLFQFPEVRRDHLVLLDVAFRVLKKMGKFSL